MTKPDTVCGALTHKKTPCQNTLVTGCGLCPVHASQLRAASGGFKQRSKHRKKKSPTAILQIDTDTDTLTPSTLISSAISLTPQNLENTPEPDHRHPHSITSSHSDTLLPEQLLYNITPVQQPQSDFYQDTPDIHALKNDEDGLDMLKNHTLTMVSPVTPKASDASLKAELFPNEEEQQVREQSLIIHHSPSPDNHLQTSPDAYLLGVDIPMDLPVPNFD